MTSIGDAAKIAGKLFGVQGEIEPLPGYWDDNFRVGAKDGGSWVLKVMGPRCSRARLNLQQKALVYLAETAPELPLPRVRPTTSGAPVGRVVDKAGAERFVWMLSWLSGRLMGECRPHTPELLRSLGAMTARIDLALSGLEHPAPEQEDRWDLVQAGWIRDELGHIQQSSKRRLVERHLDRFEEQVMPALTTLRWGLIHGDANEYNVLLSDPCDPDRDIVGLLDFGDIARSPLVCEPAIAAAYALLGKEDPLAAAGQVVAGYQEVLALSEPEIELLFPLIAIRLCISVMNSATRRAEEGEPDPYVTISEQPAWEALEALDGIHPRLAQYRLRQSCGLEPVPEATARRRQLENLAAEAAPVLGMELRSTPLHVFDLSVGSTLLGADPSVVEATPLTEILFGELEAAGVPLGVGRYDEPRLLYTSKAFAEGEHPIDPRRTIHLGLDLFAEAGTPVHAPLAGTIHCVANNKETQDFGPLVILRHDVPDLEVFYTLYGHMVEWVLERLEPGQPLRAGQTFGAIGTPPSNGAWPPHLHFQIILDLLDLDQGFPGVALASQREIWRSLCPDPNLLVRLPTSAFPAPPPTTEENLTSRRSLLGGNLSLSYQEPLEIVRGWMQLLYDDTGRAYLDFFNNVAHVGHSHPRVVEAVSRQLALLNTNTRYLHRNLTRYARRLVDLMPDPLEVCFFVNSASEANELALRLARTHTGRQDVIVLEGGYHGHTTTLIDVSPYKFAGPGGAGARPWVHTARVADPYRGPYKRNNPKAGALYAEQVGRIARDLVEKGHGPAAFIAETLPSVAGQIVFPKGYLAQAYTHVRLAGGVNIADEVQVGFGRLGTHFWGFGTQDAVPDIVVLGKPIANGFPLGAVVTTREIAESFDNGMEFFSTFGGNPVACAAGLATLDVIEEEGLQERALKMGERLRAGLRDLAQKHPIMGDVRGSGLFLGIELVRNPESLEPAPAETSYLVNRLRQRGLLAGTEGLLENVVKIRGPLVLEEADVDRLLSEMDRLLAEDFLRID